MNKIRILVALKVIKYLEKCPNSTRSAISKNLNIDPNLINPVVSDLVNIGIITQKHVSDYKLGKGYFVYTMWTALHLALSAEVGASCFIELCLTNKFCLLSLTNSPQA